MLFHEIIWENCTIHFQEKYAPLLELEATR